MGAVGSQYGILSNIVFLDFGQAIRDFVSKYLSMDVWTLLVHLGCGVAIIIVAAVWLWKPTEQFLKNHKNLLNKERHELLVSNRETKYFLGLLKKERNELFSTRKRITEAALQKAEEIKSSALAYMDQQNAELKEASRQRIEALEAKAKENIQNLIAKEAMALTERLIDANLNDENNKKIIDAYLEELKSRKSL